MAIDSRDKRSSARDIGLPWRLAYPVADGAISAAARLHALNQYRGIAAASIVLAFATPGMTADLTVVGAADLAVRGATDLDVTSEGIA